MRKWLTLALGLTLSASVLYGCGAGTERKEAPEQAQEDEQAAPGAVDEAAAKEAYEKGTCASCHGGNLEGSAGPSLEKVGAKLSKDEIIDIINNGRGQMPPMKDNLSDEEKENLAAWLSGLK